VIPVERLRVLREFIRGQANLTDERPHVPGPGEVKLNHAEALEVVELLDELEMQIGRVS
jgi:hypothetical protein